jgi:hypothetical protein
MNLDVKPVVSLLNGLDHPGAHVNDSSVRAALEPLCKALAQEIRRQLLRELAQALLALAEGASHETG